MSNDDGTYDYLFKVLMIGDSGVGKSSILLRYTDNMYDEEMAATIGVDFKLKRTTGPGGERINMTVWDTAGQEKFRAITSSYYRGSHAIVLVYDVMKRQTFEHISTWLKEATDQCTNPDVIKVLIGNKIDCDESERRVDREEGMEFARDNQMMFFECSAKTEIGIKQAYDEILRKILETPSLRQDGSQLKSSPSSANLSDQSQDAGGCC